MPLLASLDNEPTDVSLERHVVFTKNNNPQVLSKQLEVCNH